MGVKNRTPNVCRRSCGPSYRAHRRHENVVGTDLVVGELVELLGCDEATEVFDEMIRKYVFDACNRNAPVDKLLLLQRATKGTDLEGARLWESKSSNCDVVGLHDSKSPFAMSATSSAATASSFNNRSRVVFGSS